MYGFELDKTVTVRQVEEVLTRTLRSFTFTIDGTHEIYLGDAGTHYVDCDTELSEDLEGYIEDVLKELAA